MDIRAERIDGDIRLWLSGKSILIPVDSAPAMLEELYKEEGRSVTALGDLAGLGRDTRVKVIKALQDALDKGAANNRPHPRFGFPRG